MKVLVIGSGGREHALCWRLARSNTVEKLYCAPGNPGTAQCAENVPISVGALDELANFARRESVDLTVVGPEAPLCAGIQRVFEKQGLLVCGAAPEAAQLEGSKAFAKQFMEQWDIPTGRYGVFDNLAAASAFIQRNPWARVVKADGLAAGKGVFVCSGAEEAIAAVSEVLEARAFGDAGTRVVVEERLYGEEVSVIALCDGKRALPLASSQDHKPACDGDQGPNTGGMGAYSPAPILTDALLEKVNTRVLAPVIEGMAAAGHPYRGILYAGLMIVKGEPFVLEFNCRFGDPETQPLMARFDSDLAVYLMGAAQGALPVENPQWDARHALCVVMAAGGYPGDYEKNVPISGLNEAAALPDVTVFHAGTSMDSDGSIVTAGGRVLGVTALGEGLHEAQQRAYQAVGKTSWPDVHFRTDIGNKGFVVSKHA